MRARQDNLLQHHARRGRALGAVVLCVGVGCCGEAPRRQAPDDGVVAGVWAERQALGAHVDAALREAVGEALSSMLSEGQLRGRGIWQRGAVRRPGHAPPLALGDEADDGIVDGYSYKAYVTPRRRVQ